MASFTGKPMKDVYKDILQTDNSNTGLSTTIKQIKCGDGDTTALYLSSRNAKIQPSADSTTNTVIYDANGNALLTVDSDNDLVKLGIGQHTANTQFKQFALWDFTPAAGEHHPLLASPGLLEGAVYYTGHVNASAWGGVDADPASSLTIASAAKELVPCIWLLQSNILIDEIKYVMASDDASTINLHVMSYSMVSGDGATAGDLSGGNVIADLSSPIDTGADRISTGTLTISSPSVDSGKAIVLFAEASDTDDMTIQVNIKYHLR